MAGKGNTTDANLLKLLFQAVAIANLADNAASSPLANLFVSLHTGTFIKWFIPWPCNRNRRDFSKRKTYGKQHRTSQSLSEIQQGNAAASIRILRGM